MKDVRGCCLSAIANGWTAEQAVELLGSLDRRSINGVSPWTPGAIHWQLTNGEPGSTIEMPECEAWRRERAAKQTRAMSQKQQAETVATSEEHRRSATALELAHGIYLDLLIGRAVNDDQAAAELRQLAAAAGPTILQWLRRHRSDEPLPPALRLALLRQLGTQMSPTEDPPVPTQGGDHSRPNTLDQRCP